MFLDELFKQVDEGKSGAFFGRPRVEWISETDYLNLRNFSFMRWNQETITPLEFHTDGGSTPRIAWSLPGLNPWTYLNAYVVHDWLFTTHEKAPGVPCTFEEANLILAEALLAAGCPRERVVLIYEAIEQSPQGREHWNKPKTTESKEDA